MAEKNNSVDLSFVSEIEVPYYVYAIRHGHYIKIGYAQDIDRRLGKMHTDTPHDFEMLIYEQMPDKKTAKYTEEMIHKAMKHWHHRREWFDIGDEPVNVVVHFILACVEKYARGRSHWEAFDYVVNRTKSMRRKKHPKYPHLSIFEDDPEYLLIQSPASVPLHDGKQLDIF